MNRCPVEDPPVIGEPGCDRSGPRELDAPTLSRGDEGWGHPCKPEPMLNQIGRHDPDETLTCLLVVRRPGAPLVAVTYDTLAIASTIHASEMSGTGDRGLGGVCEDAQMTGSGRRPTTRYQRRHHRYGMGVTTAKPEDFLTRDEAADRLGKISVGWLVVCGILERAVCEGREGVTVRSVETELVWQSQASRGTKLWRTISGLVRLPWIV